MYDSSFAGADVSRQTTVNDHTVLSLACAGGHLAVVELLLAHGADPLHKLKVRKALQDGYKKCLIFLFYGSFHYCLKLHFNKPI